MENNSVFIVSCQHGDFDPILWVYDDIDNAIAKQKYLIAKHQNSANTKIRFRKEDVFLKKYYTETYEKF